MDSQTPPGRTPPGHLPIDVATISATVEATLGGYETLPRHEDLEATRLRLYGHLMLLIPEITTLAQARPREDVDRNLAFAAIGEAVRVLRAGPGTGLVSAMKHAQRLARGCRALLHHHERLTVVGSTPEG